jgi:hypothetical protein
MLSDICRFSILHIFLKKYEYKDIKKEERERSIAGN